MGLKLNLGAGRSELPGYVNMDGAKGDMLFPLMVNATPAQAPFADGTIEEIRASHVLEHFGHQEVGDVLRHWFAKLAPGGRMRLAVPDFERIARAYLAGEPINVQGYVMGGQVDARDQHRALFDREALTELMRAVGLVGIRDWTSEINDCAALPISLNLEGTKPTGQRPKVAAVITTPRLGFNDFWQAAFSALPAMGIPLVRTSGAFWGKHLTRGIEEAIADHAPDWVLTLDYDTVFTRDHVAALLDLAERHPELDAIAPLQTARHHALPLFTAIDAAGDPIAQLAREDLKGEILPAATAHFGLTLLRVEKLKQLPRPWFHGQPDAEGGWSDASTDDDIHFWRQWRAVGFTLGIALRVPVGHAELMIRWPDVNLEATHQRPSDFWRDGPPEDVWR